MWNHCPRAKGKGLSHHNRQTKRAGDDKNLLWHTRRGMKATTDQFLIFAFRAIGAPHLYRQDMSSIIIVNCPTKMYVHFNSSHLALYRNLNISSGYNSRDSSSSSSSSNNNNNNNSFNCNNSSSNNNSRTFNNTNTLINTARSPCQGTSTAWNIQTQGDREWIRLW